MTDPQRITNLNAITVAVKAAIAYELAHSDDCDGDPGDPPPPPPPPVQGWNIGPNIEGWGSPVQPDRLIKSGCKVALINIGGAHGEAWQYIPRILRENQDIILVIRDTEKIWIQAPGYHWGEIHPERLWEIGADGARLQYYAPDSNGKGIKKTLDALQLTAEEKARVKVSTINEIDIGDGNIHEWGEIGPHQPGRLEILRRQTEHQMTMMDLLQADGYNACLFNVSQGGWEPTADEMDIIKPAIVRSQQGGHHVIGIHGYAHDRAGEPGSLDDIYLLGRPQLYLDFWANWGVRPQIIMTEVAYSSAIDGGTGYRDHMTIEQYMGFLDQLGQRIAAFDALGCTFVESPKGDEFQSFNFGWDGLPYYRGVAVRNGRDPDAIQA